MEEQLALKAKMKDDEKNEERKRFCYHEYLRRYWFPFRYTVQSEVKVVYTGRLNSCRSTPGLYLNACVTFCRFNGPHCVEGHLAREKERRAYLAELMKDNIEVGCLYTLYSALPQCGSCWSGLMTNLVQMARLRKELEKRDRLRELEMDEIRIRTPSLWNTRHYM